MLSKAQLFFDAITGAAVMQVIAGDDSEYPFQGPPGTIGVFIPIATYNSFTNLAETISGCVPAMMQVNPATAQAMQQKAAAMPVGQ